MQYNAENIMYIKLKDSSKTYVGRQSIGLPEKHTNNKITTVILQLFTYDFEAYRQIVD